MAGARKADSGHEAGPHGITRRTVRRRRTRASGPQPDTRTYLVCLRRKGSPQVALDVCKVCKHNARCRQYQNFRNPRLFPV